MTTKWLLVRLPSGHCLRNVHRMNICNSLRQFRQLQHGEKQTNDFLKCSMCIFMIMLIIHICSSMGFDLIERKLAGISTFSRVRLRTLAEYAQN